MVVQLIQHVQRLWSQFQTDWFVGQVPHSLANQTWFRPRSLLVASLERSEQRWSCSLVFRWGLHLGSEPACHVIVGSRGLSQRRNQLAVQTSSPRQGALELGSFALF